LRALSLIDATLARTARTPGDRGRAVGSRVPPGMRDLPLCVLSGLARLSGVSRRSRLSGLLSTFSAPSEQPPGPVSVHSSRSSAGGSLRWGRAWARWGRFGSTVRAPPAWGREAWTEICRLGVEGRFGSTLGYLSGGEGRGRGVDRPVRAGLGPRFALVRPGQARWGREPTDQAADDRSLSPGRPRGPRVGPAATAPEPHPPKKIS
jgi:hypothetical protein